MSVGASASVSIVKDGVLWGLVACHHGTPRRLGYEVRAACRPLAGNLARQIRSKEEAANYRERISLRAAEDVIVAYLGREASYDETLGGIREDMQHMMGATGFDLVQGERVDIWDACPEVAEILELSAWLIAKTTPEPFSTHQLADNFAPAAAYRAVGSACLL